MHRGAGWALLVVLAVLRPYILLADARPSELGDNFHWRPALIQSAVFIGIQHAFRLATEPGTREALKGPFLRDYFRSVKGFSGWGDGDPFIVNYVGHPMMGAASSYIQIQNDPSGSMAVFGRSQDYWKSRLRAMGYAAAYSLQFEVGPLSEASIGNVGRQPGTSGVVDLVVSPTAGLGMVALEDALDRYLIRKLESKTNNRVWKILVRSCLNPDRAFANMLRFKPPWHRDGRPGINP